MNVLMLAIYSYFNISDFRVPCTVCRLFSPTPLDIQFSLPTDLGHFVSQIYSRFMETEDVASFVAALKAQVA